MKVVFIQPYYKNVWESIGIGYVAAYAQKHYEGALEVAYYQGNFDNDETIINGCKDADILAFSCTTPTFQHAVRLSKAVKQINPKVKSVFGGWHVTSLGQLAFEEGVDQIVSGEGEKAFLKILQGNNSPIVYGEKISFDEMVWPDRELIKNHRTVDLCESMNGKRITSFQAHRVCPFKCAFCSERVMTGTFHHTNNPIRERSVEDLCDEIEVVIDKLNLTYFKFVDATFDTSAKYVIDFCKEKIKRNITTEWECLIHAALASEEMFYWLKQSNCNQVDVGIESGSNKILKEIGKGLRTDIVQRVFDWGKKHGIRRRGFFLLGMPNETREDLLLTEQLIESIQPDVVGFTILCPYPGGNFYNHEKYKHIDWENTDEYSNDFWETPHFTNVQLKENQAYFTKKYNKLLCERQEIMVNS